MHGSGNSWARAHLPSLPSPWRAGCPGQGGPCRCPCVCQDGSLSRSQQAYRCTQRCPAQHKGAVTRGQPLPLPTCAWGQAGPEPPACPGQHLGSRHLSWDVRSNSAARSSCPRCRRGLWAGLSKAFSRPPWLTLRPPLTLSFRHQEGGHLPLGSQWLHQLQCALSLTVSSKCRTQPRKQRRPGEVAAGWLPRGPGC